MPTPDPHPPVRQGQRDDGKGIKRHPRINTGKGNTSTSAQTSHRIPFKNTYK